MTTLDVFSTLMVLDIHEAELAAVAKAETEAEAATAAATKFNLDSKD